MHDYAERAAGAARSTAPSRPRRSPSLGPVGSAAPLQSSLIARIARIAVLVVLLVARGRRGRRASRPPGVTTGCGSPPRSGRMTATRSRSRRLGPCRRRPRVPRPETTPPTALPGPVPMVLPPGPSPVVARVTTTDPVIFLGIDDGIVRDPAVLDYLEANQMPFTAFLVPDYLRADPAYWARARCGRGHDPGPLAHPPEPHEGRRSTRSARSCAGRPTTIQRRRACGPPCSGPRTGPTTTPSGRSPRECGYTALVMWKGATNDGRVDLQEQVLTPGDVLLLHWRADLLANLQQVKALADAQGLRVARLEDYLRRIPSWPGPTGPGHVRRRACRSAGGSAASSRRHEDVPHPGRGVGRSARSSGPGASPRPPPCAAPRSR